MFKNVWKRGITFAGRWVLLESISWASLTMCYCTEISMNRTLCMHSRYFRTICSRMNSLCKHQRISRPRGIRASFQLRITQQRSIAGQTVGNLVAIASCTGDSWIVEELRATLVHTHLSSVSISLESFSSGTWRAVPIAGITARRKVKF